MTLAAIGGSRRLLRHSSWDVLLVCLSAVHGAALLIAPSVPLIAIALWWNANTVAHNFIHRPFFPRRRLNRAYALYLSVVLGFPQSIWRERHLAHHAGRPSRLRLSRTTAIEAGAVVMLWAAAAGMAPEIFLWTYLPGWALGLGLCHLQGRYEHLHGTTSHYGRLYNLLFFNDGYHVEHHRQPGRHWAALPAAREPGRASRWPPVLRWLDAFSLDGLERLVLRWPPLQPLVVRAHERAVRRLLPAPHDIRSALIVGGGLFPRTAIVLRRVLPHAALTIVDASEEHLEIARRFVDSDVTLRRELFTGTSRPIADLVVLPLAYIGDRQQIYDRPPGRITLVHDWIWSRRGAGVVVSPLLLKRMNRLLWSQAAMGTSETLRVSTAVRSWKRA